ncbi:ubiquitin carboxyl-terminal hydrolase MINDY-1 [Strongylocentrotus purpuratus]|uniref:Ubiquitin carboxyl-terminal hydrolase n=1 Tax=Strongylocentrotus purpuratus TaxID=7668 RepID=A0A7M7RG55_STRPU|nr:ubiquitin carboxyl-terminal hydrolase MINDY-1 [Strongylocentrotus purpuratus]
MEEPSSIADAGIEHGVVAESPKDATPSSDETPSTDNSIGNDITVMADSSLVEKMEEVQPVEQQVPETVPEQGEGGKLMEQPAMDKSEKEGAEGGGACSAMDTETGEVRGAEGGIPEESKGATAAAISDAVATGSASASPRSAAQPVQAYHVKWVTWRNQNTPIITQNENGPCPLIAIVNVMLLRETIQIPQMVEMVSASQLFEYLGDHLLSRMPENAADDIQKNYEQNMHDAMEIMSRLQTGLDVNVKFTGVKDFEYTQECVVFDLLNIALYHGWLYDPQNLEVVSAVGTCSYNQLVERIISTKSSADDEEVRKGLLAEQFLASNASQLTYHGLCELNSTIKEEELCVFFRNNHFSTLYKHKNELYVLVTDQGFLTESNVVWETLSNIEGDSYFVDGNFQRRAVSSGPLNPPPPMSTSQQIDTDLLLALSLQDNNPQGGEGASNNQQPNAEEAPADVKLPKDMLTDHQLAMQLQQEEDYRIAQQISQNDQEQQQQQGQQQQQQPRRSPSGQSGARPGQRSSRSTPRPQGEGAANGDGSGSRRKEEKSCTIL